MAYNEIFFTDFSEFNNFIEKFLVRLQSLSVLNIKGNKIIDNKNLPS